MPKREEDPTLVGIVISFDPEEEARRCEEEEQQRRQAKKLKKKVKKHDSNLSKCSGATASTSKSESINSSVPDKIVTTVILEESSIKEESSEDRSKEKKGSSRNSEGPKGDKRKELRKCKSESNLKKSVPGSDLKKSKSSRDSKREAKMKESKSKDLRKEAKKEAKRQKRAARIIQRVARGYMSRRDLEQRQEEAEVEPREASVLVESASDNEAEQATQRHPAPKLRLGARLRRAIAPRQKESAASRLQNAFRWHRVRQLFRKGDKMRWRQAFTNFFIYNLVAPLDRMRQKKFLMQGPVNTRCVEDPSDDSSSSSDQDEGLQVLPLYQSTASVDTSSPDLLDAIPEDSTHCDHVGDLLAPLPGFGNSDDSSVASDELMADMIMPSSPSTGTTLTNGSPSSRRMIKSKNNKRSMSFSEMHSSCPSLRFDSV